MAFEDYKSTAEDAAARYGVPFSIFRAVIGQESAWNPNAMSSAGAVGIAQLMPGTARDLGVANPFDPKQSLNGSAKYLGLLKNKFGNWTDAVAAYNAGPGGWSKVLAGEKNVPAETSDYLAKVFTKANSYGYAGGPAWQQNPTVSGVDDGPGGAPLQMTITGKTGGSGATSGLNGETVTTPETGGTVPFDVGAFFTGDFWNKFGATIIAALVIALLLLYGVKKSLRV